MKKLLLLVIAFSFSLSGCSSVNFVRKEKIIKILAKDGIGWTIEECNNIIGFYNGDNSFNKIFNSSPINQKVYIKVLPLNNTVIKALARKEVIEKRLNTEEYYNILNMYLSDFTGFVYDDESKKIINADSNYFKGYSFKVYFENISDPYQPIFLEEGYSYFFLENMNGEFSRVTEVTGLFVEDYFQLDGYLDAVITFSPFSASGKKLFAENSLNESYRIVFNGLQTEPIIVEWNLR